MITKLNEEKTTLEKSATEKPLRFIEQATDEIIIRDITECKRVEHDLVERAKELTCLYGVSQLVTKTDASLDEILRGATALIPDGWQYPEVTCARIILSGKEYKTDNFKTMRWKQSADINIHGRKEGSVEVYHLEEKPDIEEPSFLKEESNLIDGIARMLGEVIERKRVEEALQQSEKNLKTYLESAPDGVYLNDLKGKFLYGNKKAEEIMGYKKEELIGKSFLKLNILPKKYLVKTGKLLALNAMGRPTGPDEFELIRKDGSRVWVEINTTPFKQHGEMVILGFVRDITERKRAEEELLKTNAQLQMLQQVTAAVHSTLDLGKVFKQVTDGVVHRLGYTTAFILILNDEKKCFEIKAFSTKKRLLPKIDKMLGSSVRNLLIPADSELNGVFGLVMSGKTAVAKSLAEVAYPFVSKKACFALQRLGGTKNYILVPLKIEGKVVGVLFISSPREEVSEKELEAVQNFACAASQAIKNACLHEQTRQAEEALQASRAQMQALLDGSPDRIRQVDRNMRIIWANKAAIEINPDAVGQTCHKTYQNKDEPCEGCPCKRALDTGQTEMGVMYHPWERGVQVESYWDDIGVPLKDNNGEIIGAIQITRDITERKRVEEREKELQQELNLSSRLASIGEMASGIAHEINNPLTSVIGFSQLLTSRDIPDDIKGDLEIINSEAQRVAKIVRGLLTFAHQRKPGRDYVDINNIVSQVLELRANHMEMNNIQAITQFDSDLPWTMADAGQLQQVFLNIVLNAEKEMIAAHHRGKLSVKTGKIDSSIRVSFTDDGPGISQENLGRVFEPFFTTREVGNGTGLGLSICHGIITAHNGKIYAESKLGEGTTFVVELPLVAATEPTEKTKAAKEELWQRSEAKILMVDDELTILDFLKRLLAEQGYQVETVNRAHFALAKLQNEKYDLILLDIKLPGMSGIDLYHEVKAIDPTMVQKVMFITGDVIETTTKNFLDSTGASYVAKPFNIEQLRKNINHILTEDLVRK